MSSKERSGRVRIPEWWLARALPQIEARSIPYAELARRCSAHAGRRNAWQSQAINKFVSDEVRTIELANAISVEFGIATPFWTAESEHEARAFARSRAAMTERRLAAYRAANRKAQETRRAELRRVAAREAEQSDHTDLDVASNDELSSGVYDDTTRADGAPLARSPRA